MPIRTLSILSSLLGAVLLAVTGAAPAANPAAAAAGLAVTAARPQLAPLTRRLVATGSIFPWQEIIIAPEVGGYQVAAVHVEIGAAVRKGQVLARLSAELLQSQVEISRAGLEQASATLVNAQAALKRGEALVVSGSLSSADLDQLRSNAVTAQAGVATARANLDSAELRLRFTRVTAPDDGVITARSANIGQVVQAGTEMLRLLRRNRIEWRAEVPEADLAAVRPGQKVDMTTAAGVQLSGSVRSVAPTVQSSNRTGIIYVDIDVPAGRDARPGMFARGAIAVARTEALMVPLASVVVQDGYSYVYVIRGDNTVERRRVRTGAVQGAAIEVSDGLGASERVVERGAGFLSDGATIRVSATP
ncbi:MAG: efflux RND transporter periplasmic adaptor subunit [Gammaproteobacteria bacterium]|nr:efflux RND transporter periplasmic adaptor subunit [Gammaproteobacteria bacterium]